MSCWVITVGWLPSSRGSCRVGGLLPLGRLDTCTLAFDHAAHIVTDPYAVTAKGF